MSTQSRQPKGVPVGGQYAENSHDEASVALGSTDDYESPSVPTTIRYEMWDSRDNISEVGMDEVDLSRVLDSYDLDEIERRVAQGDTDNFYYDAEAMDLRSTEHSGPFTVDIDEDYIEDYIEDRREAGKEKGFRTLPHHSTKERDKIIAGAFDRAFGTQGFIGVANWKDERDARAWARGAQDLIDDAIETRMVDAHLIDERDAEIIGYLRAAASADEDVKGNYLDSTRRIAYMIGDRLIDRARSSD